MLEVQWSSLKYETSICKELNLYEKEFVPIMETSAPTTSSSLSSSYGAPMSPSYLLVKPRENPYTKICALRRQSSSASLNSRSSSLNASGGVGVINNLRLDATKRLNQSLDDNMPRAVANRRRHSSKAHQSLDESKMLEDFKQAEANDLASKTTNAAVECDEDVESDDVFTSSDSSANNESKEPNNFTFHPTSEESVVNGEIDIIDKFHNYQKELPSYKIRIFYQIMYNTVSNIIAKQIANASNMGESVRRVGSGGGGHFKDLKEKIAATSKKGLSFDEINSNISSSINTDKSLQKLH